MDEKILQHLYTDSIRIPFDFTARKLKSISEDSLKSFEPSFNL